MAANIRMKNEADPSRRSGLISNKFSNYKLTWYFYTILKGLNLNNPG